MGERQWCDQAHQQCNEDIDLLDSDNTASLLSTELGNLEEGEGGQ